MHMPISDDKIPLWANVKVELKERVEAIKRVDKVLYSESRIVAECLEAHLPKIEARLSRRGGFTPPTHEAQARKARKSHAAA